MSVPPPPPMGPFAKPAPPGGRRGLTKAGRLEPTVAAKPGLDFAAVVERATGLRKVAKKGQKYFVIRNQVCQEIEAEERPEGAHNTKEECDEVRKTDLYINNLQEWVLGSLKQLIQPRAAIDRFDKMWHVKAGDRDPVSTGKLAAQVSSYIPGISGMRNLRSYAAIRDYMTVHDAAYHEKLKKWEAAGSRGKFSDMTTQEERDYTPYFAALDAAKDDIDKAFADYTTATELVAQTEQKWIDELEKLSRLQRVAIYTKVRDSGERTTDSIAQQIMEVADLGEFMGFKKGAAPAPAGPVPVVQASSAEIKDYIKAQFQSFAETLKANPMSESTLERIQKDIQGIKAQMADFHTGSEHVVQRHVADIVVAMTSDTKSPDDLVRDRLRIVAKEVQNAPLSSESMIKIESVVQELKASKTRTTPVSQIKDIVPKLEQIHKIASIKESDQLLLDLMRDQTERAVAQMYKCPPSGYTVTQGGTKEVVVTCKEKLRCKFIMADGSQCKNYVGATSDKRKKLCHVHVNVKL